MKKKYTLRQRLQYAFDNTLLSGTTAIIVWLALISAFLVIVFGIVYTVTGLHMPEAESMGFFEAAWQSLMRSVDPGTVAGDEGWGFRLVGLLITIGGIFILSTLIGVLTTGLEEKLDQLRKGRSLVLESGHTLILGWSDKIFQIVSQLIIAISKDDRSIHLAVPDDFDIRSRKMVAPEPSKNTPEKNVLLNWNAKGSKIIRELDKYVEPGSTLTVIAERADLATKLKALEKEVSNQQISFTNDTPTRKSVLNQFDCLFNAQGAEIYLNHVVDYIEPGGDINFYTLFAAASERGETAIGYRLVRQSKDPHQNYGVA